MVKSIEKLTSDVSAINSAVKGIDVRTNEFLKEQAYGVVSTEISNVDGSGNPLSLGVIYLENDMKGKILKFSKVVLTFPDGSNPLVIPNDYGNQPGTGTEDQFVVKVGSIGSEVFPETVYPVGSLILGLDYEANTVLGATGASDATGDDVQYYFGGALAASSNTNTQGGSPHDFKFNRASGVVTAGGGFSSAELITSKQRQVIHCGFSHATASNVYLPFGYGGIFDSTSSSGYLEYGGFIAPCDGYVEFITVRGENAGGNTSVAINVAGPHVEVPSLGPGSFSGGIVNMASDDVAYKWDTFVNQGGVSNSFNAGDVLMISMNSSSVLHDAIATAVLVLDWNNPL